MRAAVLGSPISHSLSPVMHRAAYAYLGLDGWTYDRHELQEGELEPFLAGLDPSWRGLSITMPLKEEAMRLASWVDAVGRLVGSVNTLVRDRDGGWSAYNTDVHGVRRSLDDHGVTSARRALLLGSGATARSALVAVADLGVREVAFAVRGEVRRESADLVDFLGMTWTAHRLDEARELAAGVDLTIDTLPGRAADEVARDLDGADSLPPLFEAIYQDWPTALARRFQAAGAPVVSGLEMLVHQAVRQVELMTGRTVPAAVLLDAGRAALA